MARDNKRDKHQAQLKQQRESLPQVERRPLGRVDLGEGQDGWEDVDQLGRVGDGRACWSKAHGPSH